MPRVDWDEWRHALDVFMWQAISLTMRLPQQDYEKWKVLEWPPVHSSFAWIGKLHDPYVERLRKATHGFRGATQVSLVSPKPGDPSWRVVSMPEFGAWAVAKGWDVPDDFPWVVPPESAEAAPAVRVRAMPGDDSWLELARNEARRMIERQAERDLYPSQENIADVIAADFRKRKPPIVGADGKPLSGASIKRHALKGISSAKKKALSTSIKRGK